MKTSLIAASLCLTILGGGLVAPDVASAQPQLTVQSEAAAHPRIVQAIHECEHAYRDLAAAPDDFAGNKAVAMGDLSRAIHSMRRALFFRLHMDDRAIDAAQF